MRIHLKKLVSKKDVQALINNLSSPDETGFIITDEKGRTLIGGAPQEVSEKYPVEAADEIIGWVAGKKNAQVVASFLSCLSGIEHEKKTLACDTLEKYKEITMLYDIAGKIAACLDIDEVAQLVIAEAMRMIKADNVTLLMIDEQSGDLDILNTVGNELYPSAGLKMGVGIAGNVALTGMAEIVNDVVADPRFVKGINTIHSMICAPLKIKDKTIGVMNISSSEMHNYTAEDLKLATTLAFQAALSIENARFVNELKESEKRFRSLYEEYRSLYDNAVEGIFQIAPEGHFISANPACARILGYDSPEDVLLSVTDFARQLFFVPVEYENYNAVIAEKGQVIGFETRMCRKDETLIWLSISARAVRDVNGGVVSYEGSILDITERKEKEEAKRQREAAEIRSRFIRETFGRYLSDEVVENILETPAGLKLGGEKRTLTILMTDLRGFTSIGERLPAEDVVGMINIYLEIMTDIILKYQGTIDEFIGDAIMVIFGAPIQRDDDAIRAVACAVEMQAAMGGVNRRNREAGYPEVTMGIGINTGSVVVGNIGSKKRVKYSVVGKNVNLTSRIESYTVGGQILVSGDTVEACGEILRLDDMMEVMPKGVMHPITIYEVGGIGGDFNIYLPERKKLDMIELRQPLPVRFCVLAGKHAGKDVYDGSFLKVLDRAAEIHSELEMEKLTNIRLSLFDPEGNEICPDLYAKVTDNISSSPRVYRVYFTSITPEAGAFIASVMATNSK